MSSDEEVKLDASELIDKLTADDDVIPVIPVSSEQIHHGSLCSQYSNPNSLFVHS